MLKQLLRGLLRSESAAPDVQRAAPPVRDTAFDADIASRLSRGLHAHIANNDDHERWAGLTPKAFLQALTLNQQTYPWVSPLTGDTVGDPFKDTAGPSLNILIKLMGVMSVVIAPILRRFWGY